MCTIDGTRCLLGCKHQRNGSVSKAADRRLHHEGYTVGAGFMGYVEGEYILFASETDYYEFMEDVA